MSNMAKCALCDAEVHVIGKHLQEAHPDVTKEQYVQDYPDAPLYSDKALTKLKDIRAKKSAKIEVSMKSRNSEMREMFRVFGIPETTEGVKTASGKPIMVEVKTEIPEDLVDYVPDVDENYIFSIDNLKAVLLGVKQKMNVYLVGHAGTGKSTLLEQVCAHLRRPMMRIQHTGNTEESHILGMYVVKGGETVWEPGPLQICMRYGLDYLADEYDRALPQILSVYQPVLEGKALVTKEAPPEWRVVKPHPDFRFVATGNTNGAGDEVGLYPSTALQDFANYERFGMMVEIGWMTPKQEARVIAAQAQIPLKHAEQLVKYATDIRKQFDGGGISAPISPRALINAGICGMRTGDYIFGLRHAFLNRLGSVDKEACSELAQRHFG